MTRKSFFSLSALFIGGIVSLATSPPMWNVEESVNYDEKIILNPENSTHDIEVLLTVQPATYQSRLNLSFNFFGIHNGDSSGIFRVTQLDESDQPTDIYSETIISGRVNEIDLDVSPYTTFENISEQPTKYQIQWDGEGTIELDLSLNAYIYGDGDMPEEEITINLEVIQ